MALCVLAFVWFNPYGCALAVAGLCLFIAVLNLLGTLLGKVRPDDEIAAERTGESICTFVRSFDYRSKDTWILRAVYEEIHDEVGHALPIRASDRLDDDLWIIEDFDLVVNRIAYRCRRSLDQTRTNPFAERMEARHDVLMLYTVRDVVEFFHYQPKLQ